MFYLLFAIAVSYLLGSIPCGYLVVKAIRGIDVRNFGSGNIGTTNVQRILGSSSALLVLVGDMGKGALSVYLGVLLAPLAHMSPQVMGGMAGITSIIGHNWPVFLKFKGGKGVAISAGVFLTLTPFPLMLSALVMALVVGLTRYVSLGSITAVGALPFFIWFWMKEGSFYLVLSALAAFLILIRHRSNLRRLLQGKERRLGKRLRIGTDKR
jgi:glycerol-3-phosphate acyltransferase PlsY